MNSVGLIVQGLFRLFSLIIIVNALLSFILPPYHPVRSFIEKLVEPFLAPIRNRLPSMGGFDFSPLILLILLQLLEYIILQII
jgi:YggT family protein